MLELKNPKTKFKMRMDELMSLRVGGRRRSQWAWRRNCRNYPVWRTEKAGQWDGNRRSNFHVIRNPEETRGETGVAERIFGGITSQNVPNLANEKKKPQKKSYNFKKLGWIPNKIYQRSPHQDSWDQTLSKLKTKKKVMKGASQGVKNHPNDSGFLITNYGDRKKLA